MKPDTAISVNDLLAMDFGVLGFDLLALFFDL